MTNHFLRRQCVNWKWIRRKEHDMDGERAWELRDKYRGYLIGLIWENEF